MFIRIIILSILIFILPGRIEAEKFFFNEARISQIQNALMGHSGNDRNAILIYHSSSGRIVFSSNPTVTFRHRYPPGSLAKIWTAAVFLESNNDRYPKANTVNRCHGKFPIGRSIYIQQGDLRLYNIQKDNSGKGYLKCSVRDGHGLLNLREAIIMSCNVYFLQAARRDPFVLYRDVINFWKLNHNTGASLISEKELPQFSNGDPTELQAITSVIGEGGSIQISMLKIAQTFGAIYSGTPLLRPVESSSNSNTPDRPVIQFPLPLNPGSQRFLLSSMSEVLGRGTLKKLNINNNNITLDGGKTGTSTHQGKKFATHGWNVILFRANGERFVLVTFIYNGTGAEKARELSQIVLNAM